MDLIHTLFNLPNQLVLAAAFGFMALVLIGGVVKEEAVGIGSVIRVFGNIGLFGAMAITLTQLFVASTDPRNAGPVAGPAPGNALAEVTGSETRIAMASDGHFWINADVNGQSTRFLVDTGATLTTLSRDAAESARVEPRPGASRILLHTANGDADARLATIDTLQVGSVSARGMDAVVAPTLGITNVLGMNFLSGLGSWRVEGRTLILVPKQG